MKIKKLELNPFGQPASLAEVARATNELVDVVNLLIEAHPKLQEKQRGEAERDEVDEG